MHIKKALPEDMQTVFDITQQTISDIYPRYYPAGAVQFFSSHHSATHILHDISNAEVFLLITDLNEPVGTVTVTANEICRLFVLPVHQHKGYGRMLIEYAERLIAEKYDEIVLDASLPAKTIYLKRGYISTAYNCIPTYNGDMLCYDIMRKSVK